MSIRGKAFIAGAYEHPGRELPDKSIPQIHAEVALGALADAGLDLADVDGYFCGGDAPGLGGLAMADYLALKLRYIDSSDMGIGVHVPRRACGRGDLRRQMPGCSHHVGRAPAHDVVAGARPTDG